MATLYFNDSVDNDWDELGNWWMDASETTPASGLPTSSDSVILLADVYSNSGSAPTIVNLTATEHQVGNVSMTVTGTATFTGGSGAIYYSGTLTGNATFDAQQASAAYPNGANLASDATISGNATFTNGARNFGTVTGNATFTNNGGNGEGGGTNGTVSGNATFDATSGNRGGTVSGNATFTGATYNADLSYKFPTFGTISGSVTFSSPTPVTFNLSGIDFLQDATSWTFTGGTATWNFVGGQIGSSDTGLPKAVVKGNCNMTYTFLLGDVTGSLTMISGYHSRGVVSGSASYTSSFVSGIFDGYTHPAGNPFVSTGPVSFRNGSYAEHFSCNGHVTFDISSALAQIADGDNSLFGQTREIVYGKGVNGSSILGIV